MKVTIKAKRIRPGMKVRSINEETHRLDGSWTEVSRTEIRYDLGMPDYVLVYGPQWGDDFLIFMCDLEDKIKVNLPDR